MKNYDLKMLKKKYGEKFARLCRELFPSMLEQVGFLYDVINTRFDESKHLYDDIKKHNLVNDFKNYILSFAPRLDYKKSTNSKTLNMVF